MEEDGEIPNLQEEAKYAISIFRRENIDGVLDRGVGICRALQEITNLDYGIPKSCTPKDLMFLLEGVESEGNFIEETYITFFLETIEIVKREFGVNVQDEEVEPFDLTDDFIADRLSDLQPAGEDDFNFTFISFLLSSADVTGIDAITNFKVLKNVSLKTNYISDITPLTQLPQLTTLDLTENKVTRFADIEFPSLEEINLSNNQISILQNIKAPKLKKANFSFNKIFFITPGTFENCPVLQELNLSNNAIRQLREGSMRGMFALKSLKVDTNGFSSLFNIVHQDMKNLADIDCSSNLIRNVDILKNYKRLEVLDIHATSIETPNTLIPLQDLPELKYLYIYESPLADYEQVTLEIIHYLQKLEEIDEQPVTFNDHQDSNALFEERAAEERERLEAEEAARRHAHEEEEERLEAERAAAAAEAAELAESEGLAGIQEADEGTEQ